MKRHLSIAVLILSAAALAFGIVRLFERRFEAGDIYPEYSTLRADPRGAMALYESLDGFSELRVERDFSTTNGLPNGSNSTFFRLAVSAEEWEAMSEEAFRELERFVTDGGRLVITMVPRPSAQVRTEPGPKPQTAATPYRILWSVGLKAATLASVGDARHEGDLPLPDSIEWHSAMVFAGLNPGWMPIYTRGTEPVMIARTFGRGMAVMATDSYFLSNEAMQRSRHADLLAWLLGSGRNVTFDEAHLGVTENPGVATLMRRYRLQWLVAAFLAVAILFIWKMSMPLVRPRSEDKALEYVPGKDTAAGFVNLLRRGIATRDVLATCFEVWKKSTAHSGKYSAARIRDAQAEFDRQSSPAPKDRDQVRTYQAISKLLQIQIK